jgi:hypothetical protein
MPTSIQKNRGLYERLPEVEIPKSESASGFSGGKLGAD